MITFNPYVLWLENKSKSKVSSGVMFNRSLRCSSFRFSFWFFLCLVYRRQQLAQRQNLCLIHLQIKSHCLGNGSCILCWMGARMKICICLVVVKIVFVCDSEVHQYCVQIVEITWCGDRLIRFSEVTQIVKIRNRQEILVLRLVSFLLYNIAFHWKYTLPEILKYL